MMVKLPSEAFTTGDVAALLIGRPLAEIETAAAKLFGAKVVRSGATLILTEPQLDEILHELHQQPAAAIPGGLELKCH